MSVAYRSDGLKSVKIVNNVTVVIYVSPETMGEFFAVVIRLICIFKLLSNKHILIFFKAIMFSF